MALPAFILRHFGEGAYNRRIAAGLDAAWKGAVEREVEIDELRLVVFSDHHRGRGDGADDFERCEHTYCAALGWYLASEFELCLLGDVEELWENPPGEVLARYSACLKLEREFGDRLYRVYGNHDMEWRRPSEVERLLAPHLPEQPDRARDEPRVVEGVRLTVKRSGKRLGTILLAHGHQGTLDSGNLLVVPFSRFVVRVVWAALQRSRRFASTSPATDTKLRGKHDKAMAAWADPCPDKRVLIAGHTHHPVFPKTDPPDLARQEADAKRRYDEAFERGEQVASARAEWELIASRRRREEPFEPPPLSRSSYFNTGCCSFGDGDVTGLELCDGQIRLVRWLDDAGETRPECLESRDLAAVVEGTA